MLIQGCLQQVAQAIRFMLRALEVASARSEVLSVAASSSLTSCVLVLTPATFEGHLMVDCLCHADTFSKFQGRLHDFRLLLIVHLMLWQGVVSIFSSFSPLPFLKTNAHCEQWELFESLQGMSTFPCMLGKPVAISAICLSSFQAGQVFYI